MKDLNINTLDVNLRQAFLSGEITLRQASMTFCRCGWTNFIDLPKALRHMNITPLDFSTMQPLKSAMIGRVDWESYAESIKEECRSERAAEILCGDDERNPHTSRLLELARIQSWMGHYEYQKIVDFETKMYGEDAFSEHLLEPSDVVQSVSDVKEFLAMVIVQFRMFAFHPDDDFGHSELPEPGKTFISEADARWLNEVLSHCHSVCSREKADIYELACEIIYKYLEENL